MVDWESVLKDIQLWMQASNQISKQYPIDSEKYWEWLVQSVGKFGDKYNNHPLVLGFLNALITFQEDNYKLLVQSK